MNTQRLVPALLLALGTAFLASPVESQVTRQRGQRAEVRGSYVETTSSHRGRGRGRGRGGEVRERRAPRHSNAHGYSSPRRVWVPGHHEWRHQNVWIEGGYRREWVEPFYETRLVIDLFGGCRERRVLVRAGYWHEVHEPGYYERRRTRVWIAGSWKYRG